MPTSADRSTDTPLTDPGHDDFQRAPFAERLAQILLTSTHSASSVVGLYGKWGEGKSTVLHFIEHYLLNANPAPIILHLNPWRFPDESQLLLDFFKQLTKALGQSLHGTGEKIAEAVTKYVAPLIPKMGFAGFTSDPGSTLQAIGNIAQPSIEELHRRVDQAIAESGKRVVVFIDDIDRLEKTQIQSVFRLVKLTANFRHTAYLLAFDDVMVARAIGEIFAAGADATSADALTAGQNFLEKIVQVPLRLPRARQQDLWHYCRARTQEALHDAQTELDSQEAQRTGQALNTQRFDNALRRGILPRLTTPRLAIRYANAIRFSLPLLRGEVNNVDLLLVEALNIFYPELHQFVAARQDYFAGDGERPILMSFGDANEPDINTQLEAVLHAFNYTGETAAAAKALLTALFPRLTATTSPWSWADSNTPTTEAELNRRQSVAAPAYFSRYFSYSVARGDVSDQEFNAFIVNNNETQVDTLRDFVQRLGADIALERITYRLPDLTAEQCRALFVAVTQTADLYIPDYNAGAFGDAGMPQTVRLLLTLLNHLPQPERVGLAIELMREGGNYSMAYEFDQQLQVRHEREGRRSDFDQPAAPAPMFASEVWDELLSDSRQLLLSRALREADGAPLYHTHSEHAFKLLAVIWPQLELPPGPVDYLFQFLDQNPEDVIAFLEASGSRIKSGGTPSFQGGLHPAHFDRLRSLFGQHLYDLVRAQFGTEEVTGVYFEDFEEPTPSQRLQQFIWLYENRPLPSAQTE